MRRPRPMLILGFVGLFYVLRFLKEFVSGSDIS